MDKNEHVRLYKIRMKQITLKAGLWEFVKTGDWETAKNIYQLVNEMGGYSEQ